MFRWRTHLNPLISSTRNANRFLQTQAASTRRTDGYQSSINADEVARFDRLAKQWWDECGECALLHRMNPPRVQYIRDKLEQGMQDDAMARGDVEPARPPAQILRGMHVLDVGCGGGLLSESLARLGGRTLGIDASEANIEIAKLHAAADPQLPSPSSPSLLPSDSSLGSLQYRHTTAETLAQEPQRFDVVCSLEVVEHVENPSDFLRTCAELVKPGGHLFLSTISRTPLAHFLTILMAEYALRYVPTGTHTYSKYIKPSELIDFFHADLKWITNLYGTGDVVSDPVPPRKEAEVRGIVYMPWEGQWKVLPAGAPGGTWCNYLFWARKPVE